MPLPSALLAVASPGTASLYATLRQLHALAALSSMHTLPAWRSSARLRERSFSSSSPRLGAARPGGLLALDALASAPHRRGGVAPPRARMERELLNLHRRGTYGRLSWPFVNMNHLATAANLSWPTRWRVASVCGGRRRRRACGPVIGANPRSRPLAAHCRNARRDSVARRPGRRGRAVGDEPRLADRSAHGGARAGSRGSRRARRAHRRRCADRGRRRRAPRRARRPRGAVSRRCTMQIRRSRSPKPRDAPRLPLVRHGARYVVRDLPDVSALPALAVGFPMHNEYVQWFEETGLIGFAAGGSLRRISLRRAPSSTARRAGRSARHGAAAAVHSVVDFGPRLPSNRCCYGRPRHALAGPCGGGRGTSHGNGVADPVERLPPQSPDSSSPLPVNCGTLEWRGDSFDDWQVLENAAWHRPDQGCPTSTSSSRGLQRPPPRIVRSPAAQHYVRELELRRATAARRRSNAALDLARTLAALGRHKEAARKSSVRSTRPERLPERLDESPRCADRQVRVPRSGAPRAQAARARIARRGRHGARAGIHPSLGS